MGNKTYDLDRHNSPFRESSRLEEKRIMEKRIRNKKGNGKRLIL